MNVFGFELYLGNGSWEYGLVKACSLEEATSKISQRADGRYFQTYNLDEMDFNNDICILHES